MAYWSLIFPPERWRALLRAGAAEVEISVQSRRLRELARLVSDEDAFACYVTRLGRWVAVLDAHSVEIINERLRLLTRPIAAVDVDVAPTTAELRSSLSFLRHTRMAGFVASPLRSLPARDGDELLNVLSGLRQGVNEEWEGFKTAVSES